MTTSNKTELINGRYYDKKEAANISKISYQTYLKHLRNGLVAQEIFNKGPIRGGKTELINNEYYTKKDAAKLSNLTHQVYLIMIKNGYTAQEIYENNSVKRRNLNNELINGKFYNKKEAAEISKISYGSYLLKIKNGMSAQEIYNTSINKKYDVLFEGKIHKDLSIESILSLLNIPSLKYNFKKLNDLNLSIDISLLKQNKYRDSKGFIHDFESEYDKELFMNGEFDVDKKV